MMTWLESLCAYWGDRKACNALPALRAPPRSGSGLRILDISVPVFRRCAGFVGYAQSHRVLKKLEQKYPLFSGLNLTWEVREGLVKHYTAHDHPSKQRGFDAKSSSLEAQVTNLADEITYYSHDREDGLDWGLLSEPQLNREVSIWRRAARTVQKDYAQLPDECRRYFIIRCITDQQVTDVVNNSENLIREAGVASADEVRLVAKSLVQYSPERRKLNAQLRAFLYKNLYYNPVVHQLNQRAVRMLEELFESYLKHPMEIGEQARKRARKDGRPRAICDYLAGMTDRYVVIEHERLFGSNR